MNIVKRLRSADRDSVQSTNGSRIFGEAADEIERLRETLEVVRMESPSKPNRQTKRHQDGYKTGN